MNNSKNQIPDANLINDRRRILNEVISDSMQETMFTSFNHPIQRIRGEQSLGMAQIQANSMTADSNQLSKNASASALLNSLLIQEEKIQALRAARLRQQLLLLRGAPCPYSTNDILNDMILQRRRSFTNANVNRDCVKVGSRDSISVDAGIQEKLDSKDGSSSVDQPIPAPSSRRTPSLSNQSNTNSAPPAPPAPPSLKKVLTRSDTPAVGEGRKKDSKTPSTTKKNPSSSSSSSLKQKGRPSLFPQKLYQMLTDLEDQSGGAEIASFVSNGRAFKIHKPKEFVEQVIPKYFSMKFLPSFQRQLKMYNFQQVACGTDMGAYYHELFVRGKPELCAKMKRIEQPHKCCIQV